jgi:hypothetical protein
MLEAQLPVAELILAMAYSATLRRLAMSEAGTVLLTVRVRIEGILQYVSLNAA